MTARASLAIEQASSADAAGSAGAASRVSVLRSQAPLVLRPTGPKGPEPLVRRDGSVARVSLAAGAAGPVGGDDLLLEVRVGAGSTLLLNEVSATLLLPGPQGGRSRMRIAITVDDGGTLVWIPEPVIAARECDHLHEIDISLGRHSRLLMRDELVLGRHGEQPGRLRQHLRVRRGGRPLFNQRLDLGTGARGWNSPAVLGTRKCVGTVLVVDPDWDSEKPEARVLGPDAALMPLAGPAVTVSALAPDAVNLRRALDTGIQGLPEPWPPAKAVAGLAG